MGFLAFLQRRQSDKTSLFTSPSTTTLSYHRSNTSTTVTKPRKRDDADSLSRGNASGQQFINQSQFEESCATPHITSATSPSMGECQQPRTAEVRPGTAPYSSATCSQATGSIPFSNSAKRLSTSSSFSDLLSSHRSSSMSTSTMSVAGRHVDLLDARGQLGPSDFRARVTASGSREYGEDVAERNIGQNGLLLGSPAVQKYYATRVSNVALRRQNTNQSKYRKYANNETIHENPATEDAYLRPISRASSLKTARSMPSTRARPALVHDGPFFVEPQHTGRASAASPHATVSSIGLPKLETSGMRGEIEAEESDDAFPPSIPRYRRTERESSVERPTSALGSVRRARQSMGTLGVYNVTGSIKEVSEEELFSDDFSHQRLAARNHQASQVAHQQNLSLENMLRWRQSIGEVDEDQRFALTERATESRDSRRQWSITSTEPTEQSDVSSVNIRPASRATANTSLDIRSIMDLEERNSCKTRPSCDFERSQQDEEMETCSITTDGSNIDAFMEKRKRRTAPEDESLIFNESGFFSGGGALPGLYGLFQVLPEPIAEEPAREEMASLVGDKINHTHQTEEPTQTTKEPVAIMSPYETDSAEERELEHKMQMEIEAAGDTGPEDDRCSSVATPESVPGSFVPKMYLTQRQRLLALGFDYDTDDDELAALDSDLEDDTTTHKQPQQRNAPSLGLSRLCIVLESAQKHSSEHDAARRRREAKKLTHSGGGGGQRARVRRVETTHEEADGNLADME